MNKKILISGGIIVALLIAYFVATAYTSNIAEEQIKQQLVNFSTLADINYEDVSVNLLGMEVTISDVIISPVRTKENIKIKEVVVYDIDMNANIPNYMSIAFNGVELKPNDLGELGNTLMELGYNNNILANLGIDYVYTAEQKDLKIKKLSASANDIGELQAKLHMSNLDLQMDNLLTFVLFRFPKIVFHEANIRYRDFSLFNNIINNMAQKRRQEGDQVKKRLKQDIDQQIKQSEEEFTKSALEKYKEFIDNPDEIYLTLSPKQPQPIENILRTRNTKELIELLNMRIGS